MVNLTIYYLCPQQFHVLIGQFKKMPATSFHNQKDVKTKTISSGDITFHSITKIDFNFPWFQIDYKQGPKIYSKLLKKFSNQNKCEPHNITF